MFALWSPGDHGSGGSGTTASLAVPDRTGRTMTVDTVDCDLVESSELVGRTATSPSMSAWITAAATGAPPDELPPVAHAVPDQTGASMTSATYARRAFTDTVEVERTLRDDLHTTLRPYQARGISWLARTVAAEGGAILSD